MREREPQRSYEVLNRSFIHWCHSCHYTKSPAYHYRASYTQFSLSMHTLQQQQQTIRLPSSITCVLAIHPLTHPFGWWAAELEYMRAAAKAPQRRPASTALVAPLPWALASTTASTWIVVVWTRAAELVALVVLGSLAEGKWMRRRRRMKVVASAVFRPLRAFRHWSGSHTRECE